MSDLDLKPIMLNGVVVFVVEAGTTITDNRTGETETVKDGSFVRADAALYCTQKDYDRLVAAVKVAS